MATVIAKIGVAKRTHYLVQWDPVSAWGASACNRWAGHSVVIATEKPTCFDCLMNPLQCMVQGDLFLQAPQPFKEAE